MTALALGSDLLSKHVVFRSLLNDGELQARAAAARLYGEASSARQALHYYQRPLVPGVQLTLSTNPNVAFGMPVPRWLVFAATVAAVLLVGGFFATSPAGDWPVHAALALVLGGAGGNLYDRLAASVAVPGFEPIRHEVRDFIDCSALHYPWIFNLADAWLVVGVAILMLHWLGAARRGASRG